MAKRRYLIAANWKMNGDQPLVDSMQAAIAETGYSPDEVEVLVCPPATLMANFNDAVEIGGQNFSQYASGAYTGEISANMLLDAGCRYVIVGHSERRELFAEDDSVVAQKFVAAARAGLRPVLCIGETLEQREQGETEAVLAEQLTAVATVSEADDWQQAVVAYEPVWAIGTGKTATPELAQSAHAFIRQWLADQPVTAAVANDLRILYGGSMKPGNAGTLLSQKDIDGGLIGGASLQPDDFTAIINAVSES